MNKKTKAELMRLYRAPDPVKKRTFFREMGVQPMSTGHILWVQFSHISRWSWLVAATMLLVMVYFHSFYGNSLKGNAFDGREWFCVVLVFMPFLAATCVSESVRSAMYGMEELEMSARFSLKSIILVRMGIVGIQNLLLAMLAALFVGESFFQNVVYLLVPYLFTTFGSFLLVRKRRGGEEMYYCAGLALAVSGVLLESSWEFPWIYQDKYIAVWLVLAVVLVWMVYCESRKILLLAENIAC